MKLSNVKLGQRVKLLSLDCNKILKQRLEDLGLTEGVNITVVRKAPLGDPIEIEVRGFCLAIRRSVADKILVIYEQ